VSLRGALRAWPKTWPGWSEKHLAWFKEAEEFHLKLLDLRRKEARVLARRPRAPGSGPFEDVDALFLIKFVNEIDKNDSGPAVNLAVAVTGVALKCVEEISKYQAGKLPAPGRGKLPRNAVALVQQLLMWLPGDSRLYWLLSEVLNAEGDVFLARWILQDCIRNRSLNTVPGIRNHFKILKEAPDPRAKPPEAGLIKPPVVKSKDAPGNSAKENDSWLPGGWRLIVFGGLGALLIALLAYLQFREFRRRRARAAAQSQEDRP
jgi:hypothetical protein